MEMLGILGGDFLFRVLGFLFLLASLGCFFGSRTTAKLEKPEAETSLKRRIIAGILFLLVTAFLFRTGLRFSDFPISKVGFLGSGVTYYVLSVIFFIVALIYLFFPRALKRLGQIQTKPLRVKRGPFTIVMESETISAPQRVPRIIGSLFLVVSLFLLYMGFVR